jgi:hypothetical protein
MVDYSDICEHHHDGFCVYVGNGFAIFEKCSYAGLDKKYQTEQMRECPLKRNIERLIKNNSGLQ